MEKLVTGSWHPAGRGMRSGSVRIACAYRKVGGEFRSNVAGRYVTYTHTETALTPIQPGHSAEVWDEWLQTSPNSFASQTPFITFHGSSLTGGQGLHVQSTLSQCSWITPIPCHDDVRYVILTCHSYVTVYIYPRYSHLKSLASYFGLQVSRTHPHVY